MSSKRKIIIDCDPGIDDAIMLGLAAAHQDELEILGITTVAGNQSIEKVTRNALNLAEFYGMEVPVAKGAVTPLVREPVPAAHIHGEDGLGNVHLPDGEKKPAEEPAILFMKKIFDDLAGSEKLTLVPTGPLTNIALLFDVFPEVKEKIDEIILMGGSTKGGNVSAAGEFNIWEDPEAAAVVLRSGLPIVMCGLDVTEQCMVDQKTANEMLSADNRVKKLWGQMLQFYMKGTESEGGGISFIHDATTIMYLLHPEIFSGEKMPVVVDCSDGPMRGYTLCDKRQNTGENSPITVLFKADSEQFLKYLLEAAERFS